MSKLEGFTALAVTTAVALGIASLIINIIILNKSNTINSNTNALHNISFVPTSSPAETTAASTNNCPALQTSNSTGFQDAANYLLKGLDESVDPCQDFYAFTCNKYLASINLDGLPRKGTYDESQVIVNQFISDQLKGVDPTNSTFSMTERITKKALDACVYAMNNGTGDYSKQINDDLIAWFGGVPFLGGTLKKDIDFFGIAGDIEQSHALGTLMSSWSSVDYQNVSQNALYISQPSLDMPYDYFVKPQFIDQLTNEQTFIFQLMKAYCDDIGGSGDTLLMQAAQDVVNFEVLIAMASWSDDLQRNYKQQYNKYNLVGLSKAYPNINWDKYLNSLLKKINQTKNQINEDGVVLSQPSYFAWLDSIFNGNLVDYNTIANYMIVQLLADDQGFFGGIAHDLMKEKNYIPYVWRRGKGVTRIGRRHLRRFDDQPPEIECLDMIMAYMPYGPGYTYVKGQQNRDKVVDDVRTQTEMIISNFQEMWKSLSWMSTDSYKAAINKSDSLIKNYGWPTTLFADFKDATVIDNYHQDYSDILTYNTTDAYNILKVLKNGMEVREAFRLLNPDDNKVWGNLRANFLQSPAEVNAWYQPERNSITFPYAAWNPPYYRIDFPQAYNFAGQGGTGGHELTHGFDDEGVQFDWDGSMTECANKYKCGWMDTSSNDGFTSMAQCVVSQFSSQCCPLKTGNVHCANGATTQGENIADLGGQQAAYNAYQQWVNHNGVENRLPGMAKYTPNQIFWITYGYSWCMKQTDDNLVKQLLTNPHAPGSCRVNQVMQDIPAFGKDFQCNQGSPMFPTSDQRCEVWVGY